MSTTTMEELRAAAVAYYENGGRELRQRAWNFFQAMDANRDGRVSLHEYVNFLHQMGYNWIQPQFFRELDSNHDGSLDFWEVLTLYYIVKTRNVFCNGCSMSLNGLYFTCVTCFDRPGVDSFDLCCACYGRRNFRHRHTVFLDNYVLLRSRRPSAQHGTFINQQPQRPNSHQRAATPARPPITWLQAFQAVETAFAIGSYASLLGCTIM